MLAVIYDTVVSYMLKLVSFPCDDITTIIKSSENITGEMTKTELEDNILFSPHSTRVKMHSDDYVKITFWSELMCWTHLMPFIKYTYICVRDAANDSYCLGLPGSFKH